MEKKSYKWVISFIIVVTACLIGKALKPHFEEKPDLSGFTAVDLDAGLIAEDETADVKLDSKININTAGIDELCKLPGIGENTAQDIILYRNDYGDFKKIDEIKLVPGIGDKKYEKICDYITIGRDGD